jgi:hypothetical protein
MGRGRRKPSNGLTLCDGSLTPAGVSVSMSADSEVKVLEDPIPTVWWYEQLDGTLEWFLNDQLHREDGPAIERPDGTREWWLNGVQHKSESEWLNEMLLRHLAKVVIMPSTRSRPSSLAR